MSYSQAQKQILEGVIAHDSPQLDPRLLLDRTKVDCAGEDW